MQRVTSVNTLQDMPKALLNEIKATEKRIYPSHATTFNASMQNKIDLAKQILRLKILSFYELVIFGTRDTFEIQAVYVSLYSRIGLKISSKLTWLTEDVFFIIIGLFIHIRGRRLAKAYRPLKIVIDSSRAYCLIK